MKVVIDIECNSLKNPTQIWLVVCKDIETGERYVFRDLVGNLSEAEKFRRFSRDIVLYIGHNYLGYDGPVLHSLIGDGDFINPEAVVDTLLISRLVNYSREGGHSIEQYGKEFGLEKGKFSDWTKWSQEMEDYCVRDVDICERIYHKYARIINDEGWRSSIRLEHEFQLIVNSLHDRGFSFNRVRAESVLSKVNKELGELDNEIKTAFPPKEVTVRTFTPRATKHGTISRTSVPRSLWPVLHNFTIGCEYPQTRIVEFNPASHKQIVAVLNEAKWQPIDKTQTHIEADRNKDIDKLEKLRLTGWKVNENNLATLPSTAPLPARTLAKRILLESRRRSLTEWLALVQEDGRIHGEYYGIGAWTHRMAHQKPNTANIPVPFKEDGTPKLLGAEMRSLWRAPRNRLLVGVDAEGIQLRIFAHYIEDAEFTDALVKGRKDDKTDPHSLNQRVLGSVCRSRQAAKRFIYALLLGAGVQKLSQILECSRTEAEEALDRVLRRYTGFAQIKKTKIPADARRGYFIGLDGRHVIIPGESSSERRHLCMSGYLQNGEAIIIKKAALLASRALRGNFLVNIVHDEYVIEVRNDVAEAERISRVFEEAIEEAGRALKLKCPLKGDSRIGLNWLEVH